ncbi:shwachman-Bodian-diamond syndrome protein-like protein [Lophiotrema nucula]|uniref:Shwachman-Bodian-diamond syndrome protein-like protein n=1 Tax=Lophiotrema nucula TaxID=690887 RepID=A0A6A5ZL12_9PLEO|nr:shwachman-Bodian-diamond syndrome protein-like protein [Lophiotrema nucula]
MPVGIQQPSGQVKLTNVAYVRMKKGKRRYEVACYKNKILEYRNKVDTKIDNVLQIDKVYINVSKGQEASKADLAKDFGKDKTIEEIIDDILNNGTIQIGEKERQAALERTHNEVINIVASKLVDPNTKRVYTTGMIEKMLEKLSSETAHQQQEAKVERAAPENGEEKGKEKELPKWRGVTAKKDAKEQANWAMKALIAHHPTSYAKARMRLRVVCPTSMLKHAVKHTQKAQSSNDGADAENKPTGNVKDTILAQFERVEDQDTTGDEWEVTGFAEPGALKTLNEFIGGQTKGRGRVEVLDMAMIHEDD